MCWACATDKEAYTIPSGGFVTLWPFKVLGKNRIDVLIKSSAKLVPVAVRWAVVSDKGIRKRIDVRGRQQARAKALEILKGDAGVLALFIADSPQGDIYEMTETLVHMGMVEAAGVEGAEMIGINGIAIDKAASPFSAIDLRVLTNRLSGTLIGHERLAMKPVISKYLERLDGVDWTNGTHVDTALRGARDMLQRVAPGKVLPGWSQKVQISVEDVAKKTKMVLNQTYLPSLSTSLDQPDLVSARRIATQGGWFLRDELGKRSTDLTVKGRDIVTKGLREGLGREEIAKQLRTQLPDLWKKYGKQYATTTASVAVSRARSFTEVNSYASVGIQYLEVQAVLDERTTEICRALDGTIVEVQAAKDLIDKAGAVKVPEDIYTESPFMKVQTDKKTGDRNINTNNGDKVARVVQSGLGRVDDRGRHEFHLAGKGLTAANIGVPPYHHLCRSWTIPRSDVIQVPQNYAARTVAPSVFPFNQALGRRVPSGASATARVPVEMFKAPKPGSPVSAGSRLPIEDYLLPAFKELNPALKQRLVAHSDPDAFGYRVSPHDYKKQTFSAQGSASVAVPSKAMDIAAMFRSSGHDAVVELFVKGNRSRSIASVIANPGLKGRDSLFRIADANGGNAEWIRARMLNTPGLDRAVQRYRKAIEQKASLKEITIAAEAIIEVGKAKGWIVRSDTLSKVATGQTARIRSVSAGTPTKAVAPKPKPKPKARQPETIVQPAPKKPAPKIKTIAAGVSLEDVPVHSGVYASRPDPQTMVDSVWNPGTKGLVSTMSIEATGKLAAQSKWNKISEVARSSPRGLELPAVENLSIKASDKVVSVFVPVEMRKKTDWTSLYEDIAQAEVKRKSTVSRDWILQDGRGAARFVRVDGAKLREFASKRYDFEPWLQTATVTEDYLALRNAGIDVQETLAKFYPKAEVDWGSRNLIPGVAIEEQVLARTAAVKAELTDRLAARAKIKGAPLDNAEIGSEIKAAIKDTAGKTSFTDGMEQSNLAKAMEDPEMARRHVRSLVSPGSRSTRTAFVPKADAKTYLDEAMEYASDGLRAAVQSKAMPNLIVSGKDSRAYCSARKDVAETSTIVIGRTVRQVNSYPIKPGKSATSQANYQKGKEWKATLSHEFQHHVDGIGFNAQAARVGLEEATIDGAAINIYGAEKAADMEVAVSARTVDRYDAKVYREDRAPFVESAFNDTVMTKEEIMSILRRRREMVKNEIGTSGTEFMTMARERLQSDAETALMWATNPEQVALITSVQRGHYTPF